MHIFIYCINYGVHHLVLVIFLHAQDTQDASETSSEASEVSAATELEGDTAETGEAPGM